MMQKQLIQIGAVMAVLVGLWLSEIPQGVWLARGVYVAQQRQIKEQQRILAEKSIADRINALTKENADLKGQIAGKAPELPPPPQTPNANGSK